jgi:hypothetical protein
MSKTTKFLRHKDGFKLRVTYTLLPPRKVLFINMTGIFRRNEMGEELWIIAILNLDSTLNLLIGSSSGL